MEEVLSEGVLSEGVLSEGVLSEGVLSEGVLSVHRQCHSPWCTADCGIRLLMNMCPVWKRVNY